MAEKEIKLVTLGRQNLKGYARLLTQAEIKELLAERASAFGAYVRGAACGAAVFERKEGLLILKTILVAPEYRRLGVGRCLMEALCAFCDKAGCRLVCSFASRSGRDIPNLFFSSLPDFAVVSREGFELFLLPEDIRKAKLPRPAGAYPLERFFALPRAAAEDFIKSMDDQGFHLGQDMEFDRESYLDEMCLCHIAGGRTRAACFVKRTGEGLELAFMYAGKEAPGAMADMLWAIKDRVAEYLGREENSGKGLSMALTGGASVKIALRLLESYEIKSCLYLAMYLGKGNRR